MFCLYNFSLKCIRNFYFIYRHTVPLIKSKMAFLSNYVSNILPTSKNTQSLKGDHNNTPHVGSTCVKGHLTKMFCCDYMHTLIGHINCHVEIFLLLCSCIVHQYKSGQILSSCYIIIALATPRFVRTTNLLLVACWVGLESNLKLCCLSCINPQQQMSPLHYRDACIPTIDYLS